MVIPSCYHLVSLAAYIYRLGLVKVAPNEYTHILEYCIFMQARAANDHYDYHGFIYTHCMRYKHITYYVFT